MSVVQGTSIGISTNRERHGTWQHSLPAPCSFEDNSHHTWLPFCCQGQDPSSQGHSKIDSGCETGRMKTDEIGPSLLAAFARVPDVRSRHGRRYALPALLTLATVAMLCGARSLYAIAQW